MLRLVTFNLQNRLGESTEHRHERLSHAARLLLREAPGIVCLQEALISDVAFLRHELGAREVVFQPRDDGERLGEGNPIFLLDDRWSFAEERHFWLSRTPHQPSKSWGARHRRIATAALLAPRGGRLPALWVINTHFDHASRLARRESLALIRRRLAQWHKIAPGEVVLCGDLNMRPPGLEALGWIAGPNAPEGEPLFQDAARADFHQGTLATYLGWGPWKFFAARVDYCLLSQGLSCAKYVVHDPAWDGVWLSDHRMLVAEIMLHGGEVS